MKNVLFFFSFDTFFFKRFTSLDRTDCGTLSREDFLRIPELAINPLCDRIVHAFFADSTDDRVNFRQFMRVLAHFRPIKKSSLNKLNSREEKLKCEYLNFPLEFPKVGELKCLVGCFHPCLTSSQGKIQALTTMHLK